MAESNPVEEFGGNQAQSGNSGDIVEFDPNSPSGSNELTVQAASADMGTAIPDAGLFQARDELQARLGGLEAMATVLREGVSSPNMGLENIQGIGVGLNQTAGAYTGDLVVKVFVREKAPHSRVEAAAAIPDQINGYGTDVEVSGEINALSYARRFPRPMPSGVSCGHVDISAGTIGCLVVLNNNRLCILSNNHVLANSNDVRIGDNILQPGPNDGGRDPGDLIGILERFTPLQFPGPNLVDCAAAWTAFSLVSPRHVTYAMNPNPVAPAVSMSVIKNGRTTQATQGTIIATGVNNVPVNYRPRVAVFNNQTIIRGLGFSPFSQPGDSGSIIVTAQTRQPVGLLFAGGPSHTIANSLSDVIGALGINRFVGGG